MSGEEMFLRGTEAVLRHREENSDSVFKQFDVHQKAKVCGFCGVKTWNQVPPIWKEIEATKDEKQLRDLMSAEWSKLKTDLDLLQCIGRMTSYKRYERLTSPRACRRVSLRQQQRQRPWRSWSALSLR